MSGFSVGNLEGRSMAVSHLLFADDTLIFCEADLEQILILCMILIWFEAYAPSATSHHNCNKAPISFFPPFMF